MATDISKYTYTTTPEHGIVGVDQTLGNQFRAQCRCGHEAKAASNPSTAFGYGRDHVNREASAASPEPSGEPPGTPELPRIPGPRVPPQKTGTKPPCACLCGGTTGGGRYLPGHDARHLKNLAERISKGETTLSDALLVLEASPKLAAKLMKRMS